MRLCAFALNFSSLARTFTEEVMDLKTFFSPAKLNLFLRIHRRREDGFHELSSLFQAIALYDTLSFSLTPQDTLTCSDPRLPVDASNLVSKAIALVRAKTGVKFGVSVHLEKKIPQEAGLGGGSSNAATTLWALNQLLGLNASTNTLMAWGVELGSDVSFFLSQGTAYCKGRGEVLQERNPLQEALPLTVVKPPFGLATKDVYQTLKIAELPQRNPEEDLRRIERGDFVCYNDLEMPAFELNQELKALKERLLDSGYCHVCMSGSGSALFCLGESRKPLPSGLEVYSTRFVNRAPDGWFGEISR